MGDVEKLEMTFRNWISEGVFSPHDIMCAFRNACVHGQSLDAYGLNVTDKQLGKLFDGFETSLKALKKMSK